MCRVAAVNNWHSGASVCACARACVCVCVCLREKKNDMQGGIRHILVFGGSEDTTCACLESCCISTTHAGSCSANCHEVIVCAAALFKTPSCSLLFFCFVLHAPPLSPSEPGANLSATSRWCTQCINTEMGTSLMRGTGKWKGSGIRKTNKSVTPLPRTVKLSGKM